MSIFFLIAAHAEELSTALKIRFQARRAGLLCLLTILIFSVLAILVRKYPGLSLISDIDPKAMIGSTVNFLFGVACIYICKGYLKKDLSLLLISIQLVSPFFPFAGRVANLLTIGIFLSLVIGSEIELHTKSAAVIRRMNTLLFIGTGYGLIKMMSLAPIIPTVYNPCFFCYAQ